ncbi:MAG: histidinol-phosphate transaminase [Cocleimonas sp.]|nr:histidinol-phosphate transaminase [Cocleimonas sp.]
MSKFWSPRTHELNPYTPGEQPQDTQYIKLNTNENPYPPSPRAIEAMQRAVSNDLRLYSDPNANQLKQAIADFYHVDRSNVFVGNSSDEVLAHSFAGLLNHTKPLLYPDISYSFYPAYINLFAINAKKIPLDDQLQINFDDYQQENGGIVFPNPNAPTGIAVTLNSIETLAQNNPNQVILIDEAYIDFGAETAVPLTQRYPNILVVQTFSKSRALAGLRVGFAIGSPELIEGLERVKNSFNSYPLDRIAIEGASAAIADTAHFKTTCQKIIKTRETTTKALKALGFSVLESSTNFIFAKNDKIPAETLYLELKKQGVLVRYFKQPRIDNYLRITIGKEEEMTLFFEKLTIVLKTKAIPITA